MTGPGQGKLTSRDQVFRRLLGLFPWLVLPLLTLPLPLVFLFFFFTASATDSAAIYLLLSFFSFGLGLGVGLLLFIVILVFRSSWLRRLRDRLAADGITANEVRWFTSELTGAERKSLKEIKLQNLLLADAYLETLAARLTASRIISRVSRELVRVDRRLNKARSLTAPDAASLLDDLESDRRRFEEVKQEVQRRLEETKARLQTIEAASSRSLNEADTEQMLRRLSAAQEQIPLALEMVQLEQKSRLETPARDAANIQFKP